MANTKVIPHLSPLPSDFRAGWDQIRAVLLREGEPDWVPFMEGGIDQIHKQAILGRPIRTIEDDLEVANLVGQPYMVISAGLHTDEAIRQAMATTNVEDADSREGERGWKKGSKRYWAHGKVAAICSDEDFEAFPWPSPEDFDLSVLDELDRALPENFKISFAVGKLFNLGWWLMGFDTYAYALVDNPGLIERLHTKISELQTAVVERALDHKSVGMVWHADDMAYRTGLMVGPELFREQIFPVYKRMNDMCKQRDVPTCFHSDGKMDDLIDDIINAGFDAFNPIEPVAMDIRALKKRVEGRLSLIGNVDLSYTLTRGTPAEVEEEVKGLIRDLAPGGGYALASANSVPEYVPWENLVAMHSAWLKYGKYPIAM
jgi:uroporphyrinogen decarboxylase